RRQTIDASLPSRNRRPARKPIKADAGPAVTAFRGTFGGPSRQPRRAGKEPTTTVINSNTAALRAQNGSRMANQALQSAMERLSTGKRINSAKDDAAGLAISSSMTSQIRGMSQ